MSIEISLQGQHALICGASQGIGASTAKALAQCGAKITVIARNETKLQTVIKQLAHQELNHNYIAVDFNDAKQREELLAKITNQSYSILINNSGGPPGGPANKANIDEFYRAFEQHLITSHELVTTLLPNMRKQHYGRIINIISTSVKQPIKGLGVSNTIRGAVANWAKTLSMELGPDNITVNNVLPGATETQRLDSLIKNTAEKTDKDQATVTQNMLANIPLGRFAKPEELAYTIAFLASPLAGYISGINLPVDGGRTGCL